MPIDPVTGYWWDPLIGADQVSITTPSGGKADVYASDAAAIMNSWVSAFPDYAANAKISGTPTYAGSDLAAGMAAVPGILEQLDMSNAQVMGGSLPVGMGAVGTIAKVASAIPNLPTWLTALLSALGAAGATAGIAGLLTGGGGGGAMTIPGTDIILGGPGAPEPAAAMIAKEWPGIGGSRFYLLTNGRVAVRRANGTWKAIKRPHMLHMKTSNPRMGDVVKADRIVNRVAKILRRRLK